MAESSTSLAPGDTPLLRHEPPYWHTFTSNAKMRWYGRRILDVLVEEFRDRTKHYYTWAIHQGLLRINGEPVAPTYIVQNGDVITHRAHKHEPAVTSDPVRILHHSEEEGRVVVVKPGSIPVHAAGRYLRHTLLELLKSDHGVQRVFTANRLDRLTSGVMVASTTPAAAKLLSADFESGRVRKAYICRVRGQFPEQEVTCHAPLLTLERQTGVVVSHPTGREAKTIFNRISYDPRSDTSVLFCRPVTGRTHQIRVHAQLLGHPIPNDPIYAHPIWEQCPPQDIAAVPVPSVSSKPDGRVTLGQAAAHANTESTKALAAQPQCAVIIEALKNAKDEGEDYSRLKDEIRFAEWNRQNGWAEGLAVQGINAEPAQGNIREAQNEHTDFCEECHLPLLPDPDPKTLFIYLHAIRYETDDWSYEDEMPWWALEDWATPGAQERAAERRRSGQGVRPPRVRLVAESEAAEASVEAQGEHKVVPPPGPLEQTATSSVQPRTGGDVLLNRSVLPRSGQHRLLLQLKAKLEGACTDTSNSPPSSLPRIVLEVFRGLEDFVIHDLANRLPNGQVDLQGIDTALHSSFLVLPPASSESALRTPLPFISGKHFLVASQRFPDDLLQRMAEDRRLLGTFKWRNKSGRKKKQRKAALAAQAGQGQVSGSLTNTDPRSEVEGTPLDATPEVERLDDGSVKSEADLETFMQEFWRLHLPQFRQTLSVWCEHMKSEGRLPDGPDSNWTFRVRVDRSAYHLPSLVTTDLERILADCVWTALNGPEIGPEDPEAVPHPVSLSTPDLDVRLHFVPWLGALDGSEGAEADLPTATKNFAQAWENNPPGSMMLLLKLDHVDDEDEDGSVESTGRGKDGARGDEPGEKVSSTRLTASSRAFDHRPLVGLELRDGGTALARFRAYTLASMLPLCVSDEQAATDRLLIWEPCVGSGAIAIEMAHCLAEQLGTSIAAKGATIFGSDAAQDEIERAEAFSRLSGWPAGTARQGIKLKYKQLDIFDFAENGLDEASAGSQSPGTSDWFAPGTLDGIVTDLPWGRRVLGHGALSSMYLRFAQACTLALKPGAYALALTLEHKTLQRALREAETLARKRGQKWCMAIEELAVDPADSAIDRQGARQARELSGIRIVGMRLRPYVFLLKKVAVSR
ncbi:unnamed protein product [Parajaminaea phylloscopi]